MDGTTLGSGISGGAGSSDPIGNATDKIAISKLSGEPRTDSEEDDTRLTLIFGILLKLLLPIFESI
jgi:hypothetical protein